MELSPLCRPDHYWPTTRGNRGEEGAWAVSFSHFDVRLQAATLTRAATIEKRYNGSKAAEATTIMTATG